MSIWGVNDILAGAYQSGDKTEKTVPSQGLSFAEKLKKAGEAADVPEISFKDMWQKKFPGAAYNIMDTSKIDGSLWGRNDYPWDKYFSNNADDSVLSWKPAGAEPPMSDPRVQAKIKSTLGKKAIVVPPALEEKMKTDPQLARKVMAKVESFIAGQEAAVIHRPGYFQNPNHGYLIALDEEGEIAHACVTSESWSVSSSEFADARRAREAKHAEYERLAEKIALKREMLTRETGESYYQASIIPKTVSVAAYGNSIMDMADLLW